MLAVGAARRFRAVGTDDADSNAVGTDAAVGSAVVSDAVVRLAPEAAGGLKCSPRNFPTPALRAGVEGGSVLTAFRPGAAVATAAGEVLARLEGRFELRAEAGPAALPAVEPVDDGRVEFEEPSSAQAIPQVVKIAAPTPSATASPPTRPMNIDTLIVHVTGSRKVLPGPLVSSPLLYTIVRYPQHISGRHPPIGLFA
jgi:hypothetical protein